MRAKTARFWFGLAAFLLLTIEAAMAGALAAIPTPITNCPYTISAGGSYAIIQNLSSTGTCITVLANGVDIDLGGHTITGNGTRSGVIDAGNVSCVPPCNTGITIHGGTIANFATGINLQATRAATIEGMAVIGNAGDGISLFDHAAVSNTSALQNGAKGVGVSGTGSITNVQADYNGSYGIITSTWSLVANSEANYNGADGIGLFCEETVVSSNASYNNGHGILGGACCNSVTQSKADYNGSSGIAISGLPCFGASDLNSGGFNQVIGSEATDNGGNGIDIGSDTNQSRSGYGSVADSTARKNEGIGIVLPCPGNASGNTAMNNDQGNLVTLSTGCNLLDNKAP